MDYHTFNVIEVVFWVALGVLGYILRNVKDQKYRKLAIYASIVLVAFGFSDLAEVLHGNFLEPRLAWLFAWKIINIAAIIYGFGWYVFLRMRK